MKLSIIIPVYNVEQYIEKCILSLEQQDIPQEQYEIIIINDGSPDKSRDVILKLMKQYSNIVFIDQENKGVSMARNAGMDRAKGKYLLFIDPDDYVEQSSFTRILTHADKNAAEVVFLGYKFLNPNCSVKRIVLFEEEKGKIYPGITAYQISRGNGDIDPDRSWAILYNKDFINSNQLRNIAGIPYLEDGEFIARVLCLAKRCAFEENSFYIRTTRQGSATNSGLFYSERAINGFFIAANNLKKFKNSYSLSKDQEYFLNRPIIKFTLLIIQACIGNSFFRKYNSIKARLKNTGLNKVDTKGCSGFYYKYGTIYNISPILFYFFWSGRLFLVSVNIKIRNAF